MEPAKINWQSIESVFVPDEIYENINAPQWVDLSALPYDDPSLDAAWFCKSDCKHPKTAEDFLRSTPTSKLLKSVSVSKLISLGDWSRNREPYLKRRKTPQDGENQNPNLATPHPHQIKTQREAKDDYSEISLHSNENRKLKSTLSARDVFGGRDLLGKITDLYNELKKMGSTKAKEKDKDDCDQMDAKKCLLEEANDKGREVKPLTEVIKEKCEVGVVKEKKQKAKTLTRRGGDEENKTPLSVSVDLKNGRGKGGGRELGIRTSPPTPQCFSATREPLKEREREPFEEIQQLRQVLLLKEEESASNCANSAEKSNGRAAAAAALDVFWFFKPCANSAAEF